MFLIKILYIESFGIKSVLGINNQTNSVKNLTYCLCIYPVLEKIMPIDLREVTPLGSKSMLLEQAMQRRNSKTNITDNDYFNDAETALQEFDWLNKDKIAITNLVSQMDASIGQLSKQIREIENQSIRSRQQIEAEQKLLFKQISTLNSLLKNQVNIYSSVKKQVDNIKIQQSQFVPQIGIGIIAGLMSAITILATAPWMTILMENLRVQ